MLIQLINARKVDNTVIRTINTLKAAFKVILALEEEGISYGRLDEVLEMAKDLINFTPIKHNPSNELHISFPKERLCREKKEANTTAEQRTLTRQEKDYKAIQRIIRVAIEELTDKTKGRLTTRGVISILEETIKYLQTSAMRSSPENYLDKE